MSHIYYNDPRWNAKKVKIMRLAAAYNGNGSNTSSLIAQFTVGGGGGAPSNGDTEYFNPSVVSGASIYKNGVGILTEGVDYDFLTGGGFELLSGNFTTDEVYYIWS